MTINITENTADVVKRITVQPVRISDTLLAVAGENASFFLARIDPFPHVSTLSLSRSQLHLIGILACSAAPRIDQVRRIIEGACVADAIEMAFGQGLPIKAFLKKLPATMLTANEYRQLAEIAGCVRSRKVLSHADRPDGALISILAALPVELRTQGVVNKLLVPEEAEMVANIIDVDTVSSDADGRNKLAKLLAAQVTREAFYERLKQVYLEKLGPLPAGPEVKDERLRQITSAADLAAAGDEFRNCLRSQTEEAMAGERCFYRWGGDEEAVIALAPRLHGFVIDEIRTRLNREVSADERNNILRVFLANGVAVRELGDSNVGDVVGFLRRAGRMKEDRQEILRKVCLQYLEG